MLAPLLSRQRETLEILRLDLKYTKQGWQALTLVDSMQGFPAVREIDLTQEEFKHDGCSIEYDYCYNEYLDGLENNSDEEAEKVYESEESEDENVSLVPAHQKIASIIRQCPLLQSVRLSNFHLSNDVFEALSNLRQLRKLELLGCTGLGQLPLRLFFKRTPVLEVFTYKEYRGPCNEKDIHVAHAIFEICYWPNKTLKELRLLNCSFFYGQDDAENHRIYSDFADGMRDSRLSKLIIHKGSSFSRTHLGCFLRIPSLRTLRLQDIYVGNKFDVGDYLKYRREPLSVFIRAHGYYGDEDQHAFYIKDKDGNVHHYPKSVRKISGL